MTAAEQILADGLQRLADLRHSRFVTMDETNVIRIVEALAEETLAAAGIDRRRPTRTPSPDASGMSQAEWTKRLAAIKSETFDR